MLSTVSYVSVISSFKSLQCFSNKIWIKITEIEVHAERRILVVTMKRETVIYSPRYL